MEELLCSAAFCSRYHGRDQKRCQRATPATRGYRRQRRAIGTTAPELEPSPLHQCVCSAVMHRCPREPEVSRGSMRVLLEITTQSASCQQRTLLNELSVGSVFSPPSRARDIRSFSAKVQGSCLPSLLSRQPSGWLSAWHEHTTAPRNRLPYIIPCSSS